MDIKLLLQGIGNRNLKRVFFWVLYGNIQLMIILQFMTIYSLW